MSTFETVLKYGMGGGPINMKRSGSKLRMKAYTKPSNLEKHNTGTVHTHAFGKNPEHRFHGGSAFVEHVKKAIGIKKAPPIWHSAPGTHKLHGKEFNEIVPTEAHKTLTGMGAKVGATYPGGQGPNHISYTHPKHGTFHLRQHPDNKWQIDHRGLKKSETLYGNFCSLE